jgi:site-specific DNA-methyltransferase (adenine-specific)
VTIQPTALTTEHVDINDLRPHPRNARNGDVDAIADSLRMNGQFRPIVVAEDGTILAGNHTYMAAMELGWESIAVVRLPLQPESPEAIRVLLADNRTADLGTYDDGLLLDLLAALDEAEGGLIGTGYDADALDALRKITGHRYGGDPDAAPDLRPDEPAISATGDVWTLGNHRLIVGDSLDIDVLDTLMAGDRADLLVTDPPYGINYVGKTADAMTIEGDAEQGIQQFLTDAFRNARRVLHPGTAWYWFCPSGPQLLEHRLAAQESGFDVRLSIVWVKDRFVLSRRDMHPRHEVILYGWVDGPHTWHGGRTTDDVWEFDRPAANREHPTMKPVALIDNAIRLSSNPGDVVLDIFGGSGTTLIACERAERVARLVEVDPQYADVICRRFQQFTGVLPVRGDEAVDFVNL